MLTKEEAQRRLQGLLDEARGIMSVVSDIAREHGLEPSFMGMTFRQTMDRFGEVRSLVVPDWYDDEYWHSSTALCEVDVIWPDDEEP